MPTFGSPGYHREYTLRLVLRFPRESVARVSLAADEINDPHAFGDSFRGGHAPGQAGRSSIKLSPHPSALLDGNSPEVPGRVRGG